MSLWLRQSWLPMVLSLWWWAGVVLPGVAQANAKKTQPQAMVRTRVATRTLRCRDAVQYALQHNPKFRAIRAAIRVAMQRLRGTQVFPTNPELEGVSKLKAKPSDDGTSVTPYKIELELTWKMPVGGRWTRLQRLAQATLARVKEEVEAERITLILKVRQACYQTLVAQQKYQLYQRIVAFFQRIYKIVKRRKTTGAATIFDLNFARLELLQNRASMILTHNEWQVKRQKLMTVIGWQEDTPLLVKDIIQGPLQPVPSLNRLRQTVEKHYLVRVLERHIQESQRQLLWAHAKAIPDLKFKLFYSIEDGFNHILGAGLIIPIPVLQRNQTKIWTTQAKVRQLRLKRRALVFRLKQRLQQAHMTFSAASQVFQLYEKQLLPTYQQQVRLRIRAFRLGSFSILQVLSAQKSQNKALLQRISALKQKLDSYIDLQFALGRLLPP